MRYLQKTQLSLLLLGAMVALSTSPLMTAWSLDMAPLPMAPIDETKKSKKSSVESIKVLDDD